MIIVFDIVLVMVFGLAGEELAAADSGFNLSDVNDLASDYDVNSTSVTAASMPTFAQSFRFTLSIIPGWMQTLLIIPQIFMVIAVLFWVRGSG